MSLFSRRVILELGVLSRVKRSDIIKNGVSPAISHFRSYSQPVVYDHDSDPAPSFFSLEVQTILKHLTRPVQEKVFRKRTNKGSKYLETPQYKFMTDEELQLEYDNASKIADKLLQMPPVVKIRKPVDRVLSEDPGITAFDTSKYVFTDITFGVSNKDRLIFERGTDGTLHFSDHDTRKRLNQAYIPIVGRQIREPAMFTEPDLLKSLLDRSKYEFVLDRACIQYEPDDPAYQSITSIVYQHCDEQKAYNTLRSTRHFGPMAFYFAWHKTIDGLLLELLQTGAVKEAVCLVALRHNLHSDVTPSVEATNLSHTILSKPIDIFKSQTDPNETMSEEEIQLEVSCIECLQQYISNNSSMKSLQEMSLQAFREHHADKIQLMRGLRKAHGTV